MKDRSGAIVGGSTLVGLGVGFFLLEISPLAFLGSLLCGLGIGIILTLFIKNK